MDTAIELKAVKGSARYNQIKWGIFLIGVSVFAQLYNFQPILIQLSDYFHISPSQSSLTVSSSTAGMAFGLLIFAFIGDRYPRKQLMFCSLIFSSVLSLITVFLSNYLLLLILCFIKGGCLSGISAVTLSYLSEEIEQKNLGESISFYLAGNTFGGMLGRITAGLISGWFGWRASVLLLALFGLFVALYYYFTFPPSKFFRPQKTIFHAKCKDIGRIFRNVKILALYLVAICLMGCLVSVYNFLGFKLEGEPYNLPHYLISMIFLMYAFGIMGNLMAGRIVDKFSPRKVLLIFLSIVCIGLLLISLSNLFLVILGLMIFTASFFASHTVAGKLVAQMAQEYRTTATSFYWFFYYLGSSFIGTYTGVFVNQGLWNLYFLTLIILCILSFIAVYFSSKGVQK